MEIAERPRAVSGDPVEVFGALCDVERHGVAGGVADLELGVGGGGARRGDAAGEGVEEEEGAGEGGGEEGKVVGEEVGGGVGEAVEEEALDGTSGEPDDVEEGEGEGGGGGGRCGVGRQRDLEVVEQRDRRWG